MSDNFWLRVTDVAFILGASALAVALAWRSLRKSHEPLALGLKWVLTLVYIGGSLLLFRGGPSLWMLFLLVLGAIAVGVIWAPSVGAMVAGMITGGMDGGGAELEPQPFYSIAEAKRRRSEPQEAIRLARAELEKFPADFPGTMLVASIQAEDLNDLAAAQKTLEEWMSRPDATRTGIASALSTLADWHLELNLDRAAAAAVLQRIVQDYPDTPLAHRAKQRLAHLPSQEHLLTSANPTTITLRQREKDIGLREEFTGFAPPSMDYQEEAAALVEQLQKHPADTAAREQLAVLYADQYHRLDLALDQLEELISLPHETPKQIVHWLNLMADFQIRVGQDLPAAEATLRRVFELYSSPSLVEPTRVRLAALPGELKAMAKPRVKILGHYEKNIGLKREKP